MKYLALLTVIFSFGFVQADYGKNNPCLPLGEPGAIVTDTVQPAKAFFTGVIKQLQDSGQFDPGSTFSFKEILRSDSGKTFFLFEETNGVCDNEYIGEGEGVLKTLVRVKSECDADLSSAGYEFYNAKIKGGTVAITVQRSEVSDTSLIDANGFLKGGHTLDEEGLELKDTTQHFSFTLAEMENLKPFPYINRPEDLKPEDLKKDKENK